MAQTAKARKDKHPGGRPTSYKPEHADALLKFFAEPPNDIFPTLARFATSIGVCRDTLQEWARVHPKFSAAYKLAKLYQEANLIEGGIAGKYSTAFAIFTAKNVIGWRDVQNQPEMGDIAKALESLAERLPT